MTRAKAFHFGLAAAAAFAVWEAGARIAGLPRMWQLPGDVASFGRFGSGVSSFGGGLAVLGQAALLTLARSLAALALGVAAGFAGGLVPLLLPGWQAVPVKALACLRAVPPLALVFVWMYAAPGPQAGAVGYVASCLGLLIAGSLHSLYDYIPEALLHQVTFLGGTRGHQIRDVALPAMWMKARETVGWASDLLLPLSFGAELVDSQARGLGSLGYLAFENGNFRQLLVLALVYVALGRAVIIGTRRLMRLPALSHQESTLSSHFT